jgi:hypothetical protein
LLVVTIRIVHIHRVAVLTLDGFLTRLLAARINAGISRATLV